MYRSSSDESRVDPPRSIFIHRTTQDVGIRLKGGNATGVFVAEILSDGCCAGSDLMVGDQILEINGRNLQAAIAEQVATELNRPADSLNMVVQYNMTSEFKTVLPSLCGLCSRSFHCHVVCHLQSTV